jgi:ABC-type dipeptide/oligopeptide/nickel transport system permease subunit
LQIATESETKAKSSEVSQPGEIRTILRELRKNKVVFGSFLYVSSLILLAIFGPIFLPFSPFSQDLSKRLAPPSYPHIFGLDEFGRDEFTRLVYGSRISLEVGIEVVTVSLLLGLLVGVTSGFFGGVVDTVLMRIADVFLAFPSLVLAIGITAVLGPGILNVVLALIVVTWPGFARVIRSETLSVKELDFIAAARIAGASRMRIAISHIVPNTLPPVIVLATLGMGAAILGEAGLSFLGLGVNPPNPSWGIMISSGQDFIIQDPNLVIIPGLAITITVLAFNLLGDGLRDALDPKLRF